MRKYYHSSLHIINNKYLKVKKKKRNLSFKFKTFMYLSYNSYKKKEGEEKRWFKLRILNLKSR